MLGLVSSAKVTEESRSEGPASSPRPTRPPSGKRAENRRMRTEALQRSALGLFLQYGVEAVTIDQIVDGARTAKGSFYRYFRDKTDLVASLVEPLRDEVRQSIDRCASTLAGTAHSGDVAKPYEALAQDLIRSVLQHPDVVRLYLHESRGPKNGARAPIVELAEDVLEGATRLSNVAHERGLAIGLKNDLDQVSALQPSFDFAVNEECYAYDECSVLKAFINAGKPVFHVEYEVPIKEFCPTTTKLGFSSMLKDLDLDASRTPCP